MPDRILVTGGAGFIGSNLCERLVDQGREVLALDNFNDFYDPSIKRGNIKAVLDNPDYTLVEGDIRDEELVKEIFSRFKPHAVIHLAAMAGVRPSLQYPNQYNDVNIKGTTVLLEAVKDHPVGNFLFGSSSSVYGVHDKVPFSEKDVLNRPVSPYAATKLAGEQICFTYHHLYGIPFSCLRFFTVYGPRQRPEMAIHLFARKILRGEPITVYGDGSSRRDYTYVSDIVDGICLALDKPHGYEIFNLGESRTVALLEMISMLEGNLGRPVEKVHRPDQPGDVPVTYADIEKARNMLGYDPTVPMEEGIRLFTSWLNETAP
ncbi:MAG: GDP-mannose 4,6-dehydratase [bacterium]|nr:GDP-mannose 4,6-dehydratase [bacterium]